MKLLWLLLALGVLIGLWFLFRPELLVIDKTVDEPLPGAVVMAHLHPGP